MKLSYDYSQKELNDKLVSAAFNNDFPLIKELLTSPKLKLHAEINADSRFIGVICLKGDLETVRYIFTSPELKEHANIHLDEEKALYSAIYGGNIPVIKYLLTSPELKDHANLYYLNFGTTIALDAVFKVKDIGTVKKLIDYFTLEYSLEKKDAQVYATLFRYAHNGDFSDKTVDSFREQILNNLMINLFNEKEEEKYKNQMKVLLKHCSLEKYNKYLLKENLDNELPISTLPKTLKSKI